MTFLFSGSGNSLFVARELHNRLPGSELVAMVSLLDQETITATADTVGFVFPVHCTTMAVPVRCPALLSEKWPSIGVDNVHNLPSKCRAPDPAKNLGHASTQIATTPPTRFCGRI
jgi:hypothetical protein